MPDIEVETIQDLFYYQYAKIIARSAFSMSDGREAKGQHYGFIKKTFRELKSGKKRWSDILREDWQFVEADKRCIYCGGGDAIHREHIAPRSLKIKSECEVCDVIQGIHNQIWSCEQCNSSKGTKGLYRFYESKFPSEKKFYDLIPTLLEKKYLKTMYNCHRCANTIDNGDIDGDGKLTVFDIDYILY